MENFDLATEATAMAVNSQGSALRENEKYVNSITGRLNKLKTTFEELYASILSSDFLKSLITGFTSLVEGVNKLIELLGGFDKVLVGMVAGFVTLSIQIGWASKALAGLATAMKAFSLASIGIPLLIGAVATGVYALVSHYNKLDEAKNKVNQQTIEEISSTTEDLKNKNAQARLVDELIKKYNTLKSQRDLNKESVAELKSIEDQLYQLYPNLNGQIDSITGSYEMQTTAIQNLNDTQKQYIKDMAEITKAKASSQLALATDQEKNAQNALTQAQKYVSYSEGFKKQLKETGESDFWTGKISNDTLKYYTGKSFNDYNNVNNPHQMVEEVIKDINTKETKAQITISENGKMAEQMVKTRNDLQTANDTLTALASGSLVPTKSPSPKNNKNNNNDNKYFTPKSEDSKSVSAEKIIPEAIVKKDAYAEIDQSIQHLNNTIEANNSLQADSNLTLKQKNELLEKQKQNYKNLQDALHAKAEMERQERTGHVKTMQSQGFKFNGTGDNMTIVNAQDVMQTKLDEVNAHRADKDKTYYNQIKAEYDNLVAEFQRFYEIQNKDLPQLGNQWQGYRKDIQDTITEIAKNSIDDILNDSFSTDILESNLTNLKTKFEDIKNFEAGGKEYQDFGAEISNLKEQKNAQAEITQKYKEQLEALSKLDTTQKDVRDAIKQTNENIDESVYKEAKFGDQIDATYKKQKDQALQLVQQKLELEKDSQDRILKAEERKFEDLSTQKERYFRSQEEALSDLEEHQQRYYSGAEKELAIKNIQTQIADWNLIQENTKITQFDTQLSQMTSMNEIRRDDLELLQKQLDIAKQQATVENIKNEKNVRMLQKQSDGSYAWSWTHNQKNLSDAEDKLSSMQLDLQSYQEQKVLSKKREQLNDEKQIWERQSQQQRDSLDDQRTIFSRHWEDMDTMAGNELTSLKETLSSNWDEIIKELEKRVTLAQEKHNQIVGLLVSTSDSGSSGGGGTSSNTSSTSSSDSSGAPTTDATTFIKNAYDPNATESDKAKATQIMVDNNWTPEMLIGTHDIGGSLDDNKIAINKSGKPEYVLNPEDTLKWKKSVDTMPMAMSRLDKIISNLSGNIGVSVKGVGGGTSTDNSLTIQNLTVQANDGYTLIRQLKQLVRSS